MLATVHTACAHSAPETSPATVSSSSACRAASWPQPTPPRTRQRTPPCDGGARNVAAFCLSVRHDDGELEAEGFECWLVNARDVKNIPGRPKTDKLDVVWLAKVADRGMCRPSLVHPEPIRQLRDLTRYRRALVARPGRTRPLGCPAGGDAAPVGHEHAVAAAEGSALRRSVSPGEDTNATRRRHRHDTKGSWGCHVDLGERHCPGSRADLATRPGRATGPRSPVRRHGSGRRGPALRP
ncbi:IS110 family transposase [Nonomuraea thailandensis]|uniref:IS110 family transposase n=1 Tax=Nonomuraea thailandensis TaxID=1188745 RepID=UPI0035565281